MEEVKPIINNIDEFKRFSPFRFGLYRQRELFKQSSYGQGTPNYDLMADCIQNLKCDLKDHMILNEFREELKIVEDILHWYRTLESRYTRNTEDGPQLVFPADITVKVNRRLTVAYELLVKVMNRLRLLD